MSVPREVLILYGSETGTSEELAFKIGSLINKLKIKTDVVNMEEYNIKDLPNEKTVIFFVSTTGDGDVPTNMINFWKFLLRRSLPSDSLSTLNIAIFGLGDSSYEKFNASARYTYLIITIEIDMKIYFNITIKLFLIK